MRGVPLLLWTTCNAVSVRLLSESVMLVTNNTQRKKKKKRKKCFCRKHLMFVFICVLQWAWSITGTFSWKSYTDLHKDLLITFSIARILNGSNLNVVISATKIRGQNQSTDQWLAKVGSNYWIDVLQCIYSSLLWSLPQILPAIARRTTHSVYWSGQVSGFIIFSWDLHDARGIKLNLHNSFDYTCY